MLNKDKVYFLIFLIIISSVLCCIVWHRCTSEKYLHCSTSNYDISCHHRILHLR